eukprot:Skav206322  [mRNA]  locus=scaffold1420:111633:116027:+ [translate_table: standard]
MKNATPQKESVSPDSTLTVAHDVQVFAPQHFEFRVGTVNVGTLDYRSEDHTLASSWKVRELLAQCQAHNLAVVAVQETRARYSQLILEGEWVRLISAANQGQGGVELWIFVPFFERALQCTLIPQQDITVWHQDERLIVARIECAGLCLDLCSAYAPQRARADNVITQWWQHFEAVLSNQPSEAPIFMMGDFNCSVGSVTSQQIQDHMADFEDVGGMALRQLCARFDIVLPATFSHWHKGPSHTFESTKGGLSRIDYIGVSASVQDGIQDTFVIYDIEALSGVQDHHLACLRMTLSISPQRQYGFCRKRLYDRASAKANPDAVFDRVIATAPLIPWDRDTNAHWATLRDHLQESSVRFFPAPKRKQRQLYFTDSTWNFLCQKKDLKAAHKAQVHALRSLRLKQAMHRLYTIHVCRMQEALLLHQRVCIEATFRFQKRRDWKAWVDSQLSQALEQANNNSGAALHRILKPKRMVQKHAGKLRLALPSLVDETGTHVTTRERRAAAWQHHFGSIENATPTTMQALLDRSWPECRPLVPEDLLDMPNFYQLEKALRALHPDKATGADGIGAELLRMNAPQVARATFPLLLKMCVRSQWAPELCGGWLLPLWKGKGSKAQMDSHRAILLEPALSRAFSKTLRPHLEATFASTAYPMQYGGRRGLSPTALHLQVRLWQQNAATTGQSLAILFLDLKSAFYKVAKPLLVADSITPTAIASLFATMKLPPSSFQAFMTNLQHCDLVPSATNSRLVAGQVKSMLDSTWFAVPHGSSVQAPATGSRPGDPLADLLFSFVMTQILETVFDRIGSLGMLQHSACTDLNMPQCTTWVDDIAVAVFGTPESICRRVAMVTGHFIDVMTEHGMTLNFEPGKTSTVIQFRGKKAQHFRRQMEVHHPRGLPVLSDHQGSALLPVVPHYKHLGGFVTRQGHLLPEIRVRSAQTMANIQPIKRLTQHPALALEKRRYLLKSMGMPILTLHCGAWHNMNQGEFEAWASGVHKLYQALHRFHADQTTHKSLLQLAQDMQEPLPMELLHAHKLRLCAQLLHVGDEFAHHAVLANHRLAGDRSWISSVHRSVFWLTEQLGPEGIPDELSRLDILEHWRMLQPYARRLKKQIHAGLRAHQLRQQTLLALQTHAAFQDELFTDMNWQASNQTPTPESPVRDACRCGECDAVFDTPASLAVHQSSKHGYRIAVRRFAPDAACRICCRWYHTRARAILHLQSSSTNCWIPMMRKFEPMSIEDTQRLDEADRQAKQAHHQRGLRAAADDRVWRMATPDELRPLLVPRASLSTALHEPASEAELTTWSQYGLLPPGRGGRPATQRALSDTKIFNLMAEIRGWEPRRLEAAHGWQPSFDWVPRPFSRGEAYALILFSGHRRDGDIATWLSHFGHLTPICVDLAVHHEAGNVMRDQPWVQLIRARRVKAAHAGPPCETYTLARWIKTAHGPVSILGGSRRGVSERSDNATSARF